MPPWVDLYASALLIAALAESGLAVLAWRRRPAHGAAALAAVLTGIVVWSTCYALSLLALDWRLQVFWERAQFLGVLVIPVAWFRFAVDYLGIQRWRSLRVTAALSIPGCLSLVAIATNPLHNLYWHHFSAVPVGGRLVVVPRFGPLFWAYASFAYVLLVSATGLLAASPILSRPAFRGQRTALVLAPFLPAVLHLGFFLGIGHLAPVRLAPLAMGFSAVLVWRAILREGLLDLVPVALERVVEELGDGVVVLDGTHRVVDLNPAMCGLLDVRESAAIGRPLAELFPLVTPLLQEPHPLTRALQLVRGSATTPIEVELWPLRHDGFDGDGALLLVRDVTERERARDLEHARAADRAKGRFLATVSHEIRTPMNAILGMTEILLDGPLDGEQRHLAQRVQAAALGLLGLLEDVLDVSRIESGTLALHPRPTAVRAVVDGALDLFRAAAAAKGLALQATVDDGVPGLVLVDPDRLRQVLVNLLSNAVKFTGRGHVSLRVAALDHLAGSPGCRLRFEVEDSGSGIRAADRPHVFEPFAQGDRGAAEGSPVLGLGPDEGVGLGLAIVKHLVEQMGGEIHFVSEEQRGTTFWFTIRTGVASGEPAAQLAGSRPLAGATSS